MENNNQNKNNNKKKNFHYHNKRKHKNHEKKDNLPQNNIDSAEAQVETDEEGLEFLEDTVFDEPKEISAPKAVDPDEEQVEVVGIRFKKVGKVYYFDPQGIKTNKGEFAIVDTARGPEFGEVFITNKFVGISEIVPPLRPIIKIASNDDILHNEENQKKEKEAFGLCLEQIEKHGLDMKLVDAQYTFDNSKLLFYFTSAGRVDFRDLVKDLAAIFRTRIELRQIGIRDEAKLIGGLGACGRPLCCATFLSDFVQVSIKMAKEQGLFLNSSKISGTCGRLMCCLRYEQESYEYEIARTPAVDSTVKTSDGIGVVIETHPLTGFIKVKLNDKDGEAPKLYHRDDVKIIKSHKNGDKE